MKTFENFLKYDYSMYEENLDDDLTEAIINNNIKFIKEYLNKYDVNRLIYEEFPILVLVNNDANIGIFKLFIEKGVNIEAQSDDENKTALLLLSESSNRKVDYHYSIIKLLLENGANINATTITDNNAMLLSIENIRTSNKIQKLLIKYGININHQNIYLDTLLNSEVYNSEPLEDHEIHKDMILLLLKHKDIDLSIKDSDGNDFYGNLILLVNKLEEKKRITNKRIWKNRLNRTLNMIDYIKEQQPKIYEKYIEETHNFKKREKSKKFNL